MSLEELVVTIQKYFSCSLCICLHDLLISLVLISDLLDSVLELILKIHVTFITYSQQGCLLLSLYHQVSHGYVREIRYF